MKFGSDHLKPILIILKNYLYHIHPVSDRIELGIKKSYMIESGCVYSIL